MGLFEAQGVIWAAYNDDFFVAVSHFLRCGIGSFPFKFLDVLMGANPRRFETWKPVFGKTRKHLSLWKGKHLPLYLFSFFKAPKRVMKDLIRFRGFFYGGFSRSEGNCFG